MLAYSDAVSIAAAVICALSALVVWRSAWPANVRRQLRESAETVELLHGEWKAKQIELERYMEELEELHESVERKRRRTAASASKAAAADPQPSAGELPPDPDERRRAITQIARSRGYRV